jgi:capsular polysaccharide biosynthesis protein
LAGSTTHVLGDLGTLIARRWLRMVLVTAMIVACALIYNAVRGPTYSVSMRVLVAPGAASVANAQPQAEEGSATLMIADHGQAARNLAALLNDPGTIRRMVVPPAAPAAGSAWTRLIAGLGRDARATAERLGVISTIDAQDAFYARLARDFSAAALGDTDVLKLDLSWDDPHFVSQTLGAIAAGAARAISTASEARAGLARAQTRLTEAQGEADALDGKDGAYADGAEVARRKAPILARIGTQNAQADQIRLAIELARRGLAGVDTNYHGGGWVGSGDASPAAGKAAQKFAALLEKKQALVGATPADPAAVAAVDAKIAQLREQNYRQVRARYADDMAAAQARLAPIAGAIADDEAAIRALDAQDAQARLVAEARTARLARVAQARAALRQAEARIDGAWQEVGALRVLSEPRPPAEPDWPAPWLVLRLAMLGGIAAGLASAAAAERARRTIDYPSDITRRLGIEVLARLAEQPAGRPG